VTTVPEKVQQAYGSLPAGWRLEKLKFFAATRNSNVDKTISDDEEPVSLCNYTDVYYNDRITSDLAFMAGSATPAEIEKFQLRRDQVILTKDSEEWDDIGIPALVVEDMPGVLCGYHLSVLEPGLELDGGFLAWLCRSDPLNDQFKLGANGVTRYGLGQYPMKNAFVALPSLVTQKRIAAFLAEKTAQIDALIEKKRALLNRLAEKRQATVTQAVTKGLDPTAPMKDSGIDWLGQIPAHWEVCSLRYAAENLNRMRVPIAAELRKGIERLFPYYGASGVIDYVDEYIFDFPTVLVAEDGANLLSRSTPLAFAAAGQYWVNNHAHILRPHGLSIWYCTAELALYPLDPYISGSAQPKLTKDNLMALSVWLPPVDEQKDIERWVFERLEALDPLVEKCVSSLNTLDEYRSTLITAAVTGQIEGLR
jgi:type I restriction enzyme, S subunit